MTNNTLERAAKLYAAYRDYREHRVKLEANLERAKHLEDQAIVGGLFPMGGMIVRRQANETHPSPYTAAQT